MNLGEILSGLASIILGFVLIFKARWFAYHPAYRYAGIDLLGFFKPSYPCTKQADEDSVILTKVSGIFFILLGIIIIAFNSLDSLV